MVAEKPTDRLQQLEQRRLIWRGRDSVAALPLRASGWPEFDRRLGGLPQAGATVIHGPTGIGEIRLLWGARRDRERLGMVINPPARLGAEAWQEAAPPLDLWRILRPAGTEDGLWAAEQCLRSGCCDTVWLWQPRPLTRVQARRLQLAARRGEAALFLFLQTGVTDLSLPVDLHLQLSPHASGIGVAAPRRRQGWPVAPFVVAMASLWPELTLAGTPAGANDPARPEHQSAG